MTSTPEHVNLGRVFHLEYPRMKHEENSNRGDREAVRSGCDSTDHDWQKDADGKIWRTHWKEPRARDGFRDPLHKVPLHAKFHDLHEDAIRRLFAITNGHTFHITTAEEGIIHAASVGLRAVRGEAKPGNKWTVQDFRHLRHVAEAHGIKLVIATLDDWPGWKQTLRNARAAGCDTRRLRAH